MRGARTPIAATTLLLVVGLLSAIAGCTQKRSPARYLIPDGFVGWVEVQVNVAGAPEVMREGSFLVFHLRPSGRAAVSAPPEFGWASDEFYYVKADGTRQRLPVTMQGNGGMVWAATNGHSTDSNGNVTATYERFFVGSENQWKAQDTAR